MAKDEIVTLPKPVSNDPDIKTDKQFFITVNYDFRKLYKKGALYIGRRNLYGIWNNLMYFLFRKMTRKTYKNNGRKNGLEPAHI